jgi:hypothetical protein
MAIPSNCSSPPDSQSPSRRACPRLDRGRGSILVDAEHLPRNQQDRSGAWVIQSRQADSRCCLTRCLILQAKSAQMSRKAQALSDSPAFRFVLVMGVVNFRRWHWLPPWQLAAAFILAERIGRAIRKYDQSRIALIAFAK